MHKKITFGTFFFFVLIIFCGLKLSAQTESVFLHIDKTICYPGDTVWFRGSIFEDNHLSNLSTNLYVELFDDSNRLCTRKVFPIASSVSIGQVELPKRSGLYWIRSYTRNSSFYLQSLTIRNAGKIAVIRKFPGEKEVPYILDTFGLFFNTVNTSKGISCTIIPDSNSKYNNKQFKLLLKNYNNNAGEYTFTLNEYHQRNILINRDSIRGYLSLLFYNADTLVARQDIFVQQKNIIPVELERDRDGYQLEIKDDDLMNYSVAIVKDTLDDSHNDNFHCFTPPNERWTTDISHLSYKAKVSSIEKKSSIKRGDLAVIFQKDSLKETRLIPIDSTGNISLSGLYFFDTTYLYYRMNERTKWDVSNDVQLSFIEQNYPSFKAPDSQSYLSDTVSLPIAAKFPDFDSTIYMTPAIVTPAWSERNRLLDNRYTSGRFSNPTRYSFDMIHSDLKYDYDLMDFLKKSLPGFSGGLFDDTPRYIGRPVVFYLDQQLTNWRVMPSHLQGFAYIKILEDFVEDNRYIRLVSDIPQDLFPTLGNPKYIDYCPRAMICVYTRKDEDFRFIKGELNTISIKGYDRPIGWVQNDRNTLLWDPYIDRKEYDFSIPLSHAHYFKIIVNGITHSGEAVHFERIVNQLDKYFDIAGVY